MRISLLILLGVASTCVALPFMMYGRTNGGFMLRDPNRKPVQKSTLVGHGFIDQVLDHSNTSDSRTWKQRYFYNLENAIPGSGVNFLFVDGEATGSDEFITGQKNPLVQYAKRFGASLYSLEHRFYGASRPTPNITVDELQFLSSKQALADLAEFVRQVNDRNAGTTQKWVAFGGSYPGSLSLWFREKYPDVVVGAVGSSAPLLAQVDFYGYMATVEKDVLKFDAAITDPAKKKCAEQIGKGMDDIAQNMLSAEGRDILDTKFDTHPPLSNYTELSANSQAFFYLGVIGTWKNAAQYGGLQTTPNVNYLCTIMQQDKDAIDSLAEIVTSLAHGIATDYQTQVDELSSSEWDVSSNDLSNARSWAWQTCSEFGFFHSTDMGSNIFRSGLPSNNYINICKDVFGIDIDTVRKSVEETNEYYGGRDYYTGTNVVISYGTQDPWHFLAKQESQHESVVIAPIEGGVHIIDLYSPDITGTSSAAVNRTQQLTIENIDKWLNGYDDVPKNIVISDSVGQRPSVYTQFHAAPEAINFNAGTYTIATRAKRSSAPKSKNPPFNVFTGRLQSGLLQPPDSVERSWPPSMRQGTIPQPWDHFDNANHRTFLQTFYVNEVFGSTNGPNFLMLGGESPESDAWVTNLDVAWMTYAKEVNANVFLLEHRYYGVSKPATNDLQFLTSAQMLHDVASFIKFVKKERNSTGPWITFGGSYSGALSAWAREWFPELIAGAVASSGPVEAKNDFYEYLKVVENVLTSVDANCSARVKEAFDSMTQLSLSPAGRASLTTTFQINSGGWADDAAQPVPQENIQTFFRNIYGLISGIVQYSGDNRKGSKITAQDICTIMTNTTEFPDAVDAVRAVQELDAGEAVQTSALYQARIVDLKAKLQFYAVEDHGGFTDGEFADVLWTWQTCNEFGYFQSTDYGSGIFGNAVPLNYFVEMCEQVFGIGMDRLAKGVGRNNYQYGGRANFKGTNVVFPNGNHDPWHALGVLERGNLDASVVPIVIEGTAHCADMYAARESDSQQLKEARTEILRNIKSWLGFTPAETTTVASMDSSSSASPPPEPSTKSSSSSWTAFSTVLSLLVAAVL